MPEMRREPNTDEGEYVVKVRRKKKRKDSASPVRRKAAQVTRDWSIIDILKRAAAFVLVIAVFAGIVYVLLQPPS